MVEYGHSCTQGRVGQGLAAAKARTGPADTVRRELLILSSWVAERAPCELLVGGGGGAEAAPLLLPKRRLRQKCPTCEHPFLNQKSYDKHLAAAKCRRPFLNQKPCGAEAAPLLLPKRRLRQKTSL
ncbi:unnamed protein product [Polarella glacialis]|uniref:Uncharacterized protein n=1 Tax=Polarella glacialis TaxID=89957 RepID=A0A813L1S0_POLGL|nr:unnamed protein product [Polarella glacialis]